MFTKHNYLPVLTRIHVHKKCSENDVHININSLLRHSGYYSRGSIFAGGGALCIALVIRGV